MKVIIIGEAPSKRGVEAARLNPCGGLIGEQLAHYCGVTYEQYLEMFERTNLLDYYPGEAGKGSSWEAEAAQKRASVIDLTDTFAVVLGLRAGKAFGLNIGYFCITKVNGGYVAVVPHPSGVNRWFNEVENVKRMSAFMHEVVMIRQSPTWGKAYCPYCMTWTGENIFKHIGRCQF